MVQDPLFDLTDKVIVVTGAAGGLGSAICKALALRDARIIVTDLRLEDAETVAGECADGTKAEARALDILDEAAVETALRQVAEQHGRLDGLVNAAGVFHIAPITEMSSEDFRTSIECNLTGPFLLTQAAARIMQDKGGGRIVHLASVSSTVANPHYAAYASSKAALSQLVRVAARELAPKGITVNAIGQAMTETPLSAAYLADPAYRARVIAQIPMGRLCTPDDILATVILLMAPGGGFITGQTMYVDGGRTLV